MFSHQTKEAWVLYFASHLKALETTCNKNVKNSPRIRVKLLCLSSVIPSVTACTRRPSKLFAKIENFLRFQLARKSITLLFFHNVLAPQHPKASLHRCKNKKKIGNDQRNSGLFAQKPSLSVWFYTHKKGCQN